MAETKARFLANLIGADNTANDFTLPNTAVLGTNGKVLTSGGDGTVTWKTTELAPTTTSISPTEVESADDQTTGGNQTFTLTGENYATSGMTVELLATSGSNITSGITVTHGTATSFTITLARNLFVNANEPYSVKVTKSSGLTHTLSDAIRVDNSPSFTASPNTIVASIADNVSNATHATIAATDAESDAITFAEVGTTLYNKFTSATPRGVQSDGTIKGVPADVSADETTTFTVRATSTGNGGATTKTTDQNFRFTITNYLPPVLFSGKIYEGTNTTGQSLNFPETNPTLQPDFLWFKSRDNANSHALYDSLRGINSALSSNSDSSANTSAPNNEDLVSFDSDGFTLGPHDSMGSVNEEYSSNASKVAYGWKAGGAPTATNSGGQSPTSGSVMINGSASTANLASATLYPKKMSVNTNTGFSIVQYQGTADTSNTIPHGLSQRPDFIIIKKINNTGDWIVWHKDLTNATATSGVTNDHRLYLNINLAEGSGNNSTFHNTVPSSSVVTIGNNAHVNGSGSDFIMYCFHSVSNYSAFGSYTGTASETIGFKPRLLMIKSLAEHHWFMFDVFREGSDDYDSFLRSDLSNVEFTSGDTALEAPVSSTGFTTGSHVGVGGSSQKYIYMAFA